MKTKEVTLKNPRTGEIWICEDYSNRRKVDGSEFVEVRQPGAGRKVWMSLSALVKAKDSDLKSIRG
jgi:hypothetical protein